MRRNRAASYRNLRWKGRNRALAPRRLYPTLLIILTCCDHCCTSSRPSRILQSQSTMAAFLGGAISQVKTRLAVDNATSTADEPTPSEKAPLGSARSVRLLRAVAKRPSWMPRRHSGIAAAQTGRRQCGGVPPPQPTPLRNSACCCPPKLLHSLLLVSAVLAVVSLTPQSTFWMSWWPPCRRETLAPQSMRSAPG